jgi:hypothetical protein
MWLGCGAESPARPKHTLEYRKVMVTIGLSVADFQAMVALPKGQKFNVTYDTDVVLRGILDSRLKAGGSPIIIHTGNARPHTAQTLQIVLKTISSSLPQSPYSSYLAPRDFYLFGYIKVWLKECQFSSTRTSSRPFKESSAN